MNLWKISLSKERKNSEFENKRIPGNIENLFSKN